MIVESETANKVSSDRHGANPVKNEDPSVLVAGRAVLHPTGFGETLYTPTTTQEAETIKNSDPVETAQTRVDDAAVDRCIEKVAELLHAADAELASGGPANRRQAQRLRQVATNQSVADLTMALSDEVLRIQNHAIAAQRFHDVVQSSSLEGFGLVDRALLRIGATLAPKIPSVVMPLVQARLRAETSQTILDARPKFLNRHQAKREAQGRKLNFNRLGEAILGSEEAERRLTSVIELIERPGTTNVSVKASSIVANLSVLSYDETIRRVEHALRQVFLAAAAHGVFVNVDMEEYRDLRITADAFMGVLQEPGLVKLYAGIVLQAYVPDSHVVAEELGEWARRRVKKGGSPIRIRLVKGANLAMEHVDAEMHGWNTATYPTKADVDASWKRLLDSLLQEGLASAIHVGIASHNLFDVAWALQLRDELPVEQRTRVSFEMLEGMAESQASAVAAATGNLLMYTPVVEPEDFVAAIGYLTRRLDENTAPDNFLRSLFDLKPGSEAFIREADRFRASVHHRHQVTTDSFRALSLCVRNEVDSVGQFQNEPDTDFTQPQRRKLILDAVTKTVLARPFPIVRSVDQVDQVVATAREALSPWAAMASRERAKILRRVGDQISSQRAAIIATIVVDAAKTIGEADPEVSEAVDFARYYANLTEELDLAHPPQEAVGNLGQSERGSHRSREQVLKSEPLGVVVVAPPWNFAYAIAMGGVLGALGAGNTVILKPAPQAPRTAQRVAQDCWDAGVPRDALQLLAVPDDEVGRHLITHEGVDAVILTGALATARMFLDWKPSLRLLAETSGKNSLIVTATADLDLAIKDLVKSAFGHGGQKCSAASLAIVEASVFDDPAFARRLGDAVKTLRCGEPGDPSTDIAPLIEPPSAFLQRALTTLDAGEWWLVKPERFSTVERAEQHGVAAGSQLDDHRSEDHHAQNHRADDRPADDHRADDHRADEHYDTDRNWSPGVRMGVSEGSWFHRTECFGPVLGVMRARDLDHAIALQNATEYGLTAGIHSLDPYALEHWKQNVAAGNLYVNRSITGAIVNRQPFGGWKASTVGSTAKAGGPHYLETLRRWVTPVGLFDTSERLENFQSTMRAQFVRESDPSGLVSETNTLRYRALPRGVVLRIGMGAPSGAQRFAEAAARATYCPLHISSHTQDSEAACIEQLQALRPDRLRVVGACSDSLRRAANELGIRIDETPVVPDSHIEITKWAREQAVSETQHRHGRLIK
jgi:RHH-type transcriptional regulator, proline utilization regulon repressor / proline dehydrogenase / delta 1-pyrroline-5-carboxylate dehydrogenase